MEFARNADGSIPLEEFSELREHCLALRDILIPEEIWPRFREWHALPDEEGAHSSVALLAFRRGLTPLVTSPIHEFLLSAVGPLPNLRNQYLKDLREKWMFADDPMERHRLSRIFRGRLAELQFASWLQSRGHTIVGLEAITEGPDIMAVAAEGESYAYEVKFIGLEDANFATILRSMHGQPAGGAVAVYRPINYLLLRIYEAARQLRAATKRKKVVVIIDELAWYRFDMQLRGNWIDWSNPQFVGLYEDDWRPLLSMLKDADDLPTGLGAVIREVDSVNIFRQNYAFEFRLEKDVALSERGWTFGSPGPN
jgi:hypothetical protein